ncbi:ParB/RepB/Spo0J family partition protein [Pseudoflavonifractor sp. 524-17]|uniref:ParB/RepB/Spo0J family partition protein n=1 Tax=Pseudoflavonifractor sp. 524-17 TaxID=2304577 RepID=UPI0013796D3D|nr:ParB/RepB/Spo0J family partition protein [Pseudoflavonifractor sp. 524-17]NCE65659.1 ParB/RepB/Spo0J family partition protein [Pseudoflavonifractor sp. 524-17]
MKSSAGKIQLTGFDDLFQTGGHGEDGVERVQEVPLTELFPFKDHPFQVKDDEAMEKTAQSIAEHGVLVPGIVRPRREGGYEIVAGHRRKHGSELAGKTAMPVLIRALDDDEATIIMVDSNLQREKILPSEKAWAYRMKLEALKHQGQRRDLTLERGVPKLPARDRIAQEAGENCGLTVTRYIALTKLIPPLLVLVDEEKLAVSTAADYLSDLPENEQTDLAAVMEKRNVIPVKSQLAKIKQYSREGTLSAAVMDAILTEQRPVPVQVVLRRDRLKHYFPQSYTAQQMEEVIVSLLETWRTQHS